MKLKCSLCRTTYDFFYNKDEPLDPNFPFCSKRCKSLDLGNWLNEEYRISTQLQATVLEENDISKYQNDIQLILEADQEESD